MTSRNVDGTTYAMDYDPENRLISITGGTLTARYVFDGDGRRVLAVVGDTRTLYVNEYFEVTMENGAKVNQDLTIEPVDICENRYCFFMPLMLSQSDSLGMSNGNFGTGTFIPQGMQPDNTNVTWRVYYMGGALRVQTTTGDVVSYLVQDHLNSTAITISNTGAVTGEMVYSAWGGTRYSFGATPTDRLYTGQYEAEAGLYFYNARWYDNQLGRFAQADSIIAEPGSPQSWDRYVYVNNNPVIYNDPSGHVIARGCSDPISCGAFSNIYQVAEYLYQRSNYNDADFLVNLYTTNYLPGETAKERTNVIFDLTYSDPYQHFGGKYGDTGFKEEFQDRNDQIGHFVTGVRLGIRKNQLGVFGNILESLAIGHEMISDNVFEWDSRGFDPNSTLQWIVGITHPKVHNLFDAGEYGEILNYYDFIDPVGYGNSIADLKLTNLAFEFSILIVDLNTTNTEAAKWLQNNLCK